MNHNQNHTILPTTRMPQDSGPEQHWPTIRAANLLYLLMIVLLVTAGTVMQARSFSWGVLGTEVLVLLLPALVFLRWAGLPLRETLRLHWPGDRLAGLSLLLGIGLWLVATWLEEVMSALFGYVVPGPVDSYPTTPVEAVLVFLVVCVCGSICEEVLFRGYIQRAYERRGPWVGILLGGALFALYHMRLKGLLPLIPAALSLGYVVWRSGSLVPGILVHFANNALGSGLLITAGLRHDLVSDVPFPSVLTAIVGAALVLVTLWLFWRCTEPKPLPALSGPLSWARRSWPLYITALIYLGLASAEFVNGRYPEALSLGQTVQLEAAGWEEPTRWQYELRNILDEPVGEAVCQLSPREEAFLLDCEVHQEAFEVQRGRSSLTTNPVSYQQTTYWRRDDLRLVNGEGVYQSGECSLTLTLHAQGEDLVFSIGQDREPAEALVLPTNTLVGGEWPWRLSALPFSPVYVREVTLIWPGRWCEETQESSPRAEKGHVVVRGAEPLTTPAGGFIAWRVEVGDHATAWYDSEPPHTLISYYDGTVTYVLTGIEGNRPSPGA